jgi:two-component system response regulator AtoC
MKRIKILVVDDDQKILFAFREVLKRDGHIYQEAFDGLEALDKVKEDPPDIIFMDISMPRMDGLQALKEIKKINSTIPVIMITGEGTMQTAIQAMQYGAFQYLMKPLSIPFIREEISKALASINSYQFDRLYVHADSAERYQLIGNSKVMHDIYKMIGSICTTPNPTTVLITGETGTGKELVARAIHDNSSHAKEPFIAINSTALPETLLESELFGHERGAFTGAIDKKIGKFELAGQGTIFLDEIGDLYPDLQIKLLRVLQEREFERLGDTKPIRVGARFIAATNQDLQKKIRDGELREDLYFRLNVVNIDIPPLREHKEDIFMLAHFFLARYNQQQKKNITSIAEDALSHLQDYSYPGNIRELENIIERAVMLTQGNVIIPSVLGKLYGDIKNDQVSLPMINTDFTVARDHVINQFEKQFINTQLTRYKGNVSAAAKASNMSRQNLHRLMVKHGVNTKNQKPS